MSGTNKRKIKINRFFLISLPLLAIFLFFLRFNLVKNNNFYFTVDQGKDALFVREIVERHQILLKGPVTSVEGVYAGPLWFYFIGLGYLIFRGNPIGGPFVMILLHLGTTVFLIYWLGKYIRKETAFLIGVSLQFYWRFFETSIWAFNPFPLASIGIILSLLLTSFIAEKKKKYYFWALIPILSSFNAEIAGAVSLLVFYAATGFWGYRKKIIKLREYTTASFVIPGILTLPFVLDLYKKFERIDGLYSGKTSGLGTFSRTNFTGMFATFIKMVTEVAGADYFYLGLFMMLVVVVFYFNGKRKNPFVNNFVFLTLLLLTTSFLFFGSNYGYRDWHTLYLPPILFVAYLLALTKIGKSVGLGFFILTMIFQLSNFRQRYSTYPYPPDDPGILANQLSAVDWIYQNSDNDGFNVYNYTDRYYDYSYQYLFWWYGRGKYKYLPCEYANYPLSHKNLYVPGYAYYTEPKLGCLNNNFLIIESTTNGQSNANWIDGFRDKTALLDYTYVGKIRIEKRLTNQ